MYVCMYVCMYVYIYIYIYRSSLNVIHSECATPVHLFRSLCAVRCSRLFEGERILLLWHPPSLMGWGCCRRCVAVEKPEVLELCVSAPECPQNASPGGSIYQRSQVTGLLRRHVRTSSEELDRFQSELEARQASTPPAYGNPAWWRCDDLWRA